MNKKTKICCAILCLGLELSVNSTWAATIPDTPFPRIDAGMHNAEIEQIRLDEKNNRVISIGFDKTIRIWQLPQLKLIRTIPLPSQQGYEGTPFGLAVSPDGKTIAVGGWTGWDWHEKASLYFFNIDSGQMIRRIGQLPALVGTLAYSADGRYLAVGLHDHKGLRLYDTQNWKMLWQDTEYGERVTFVDISADGRVATTAADGYVRLYQPDGKLYLRQEIGVSKQLGGIRFSPDGKRIAFGIMDQPYAMVLAADGSQILATHHIQNVEQKSLCCIAWSKDSQFLYLNGRYQGQSATPLYRYAQGGIAAVPQQMNVGKREFTNMLPLVNGNILFATNTPSFGIVNPQGQLIQEWIAPILRFDQLKDFRLSADARQIQFTTAKNINKTLQVDIGQWLNTSTTHLFPALKQHPHFKLEIQNREQPKLNGKLLEFDKFEKYESHVISQDGKNLYLGSGWAVRVYNIQGQQQWHYASQTPVEQINSSQDGRWVVVALADGTLRWLDAKTGQEQLGLYIHPDDFEWVAWRPDGVYASSLYGDQYMGWVINRGEEQTPRFVRAVQMERQLYQPDAIKTVFNQAKNQSWDARSLLKQLPPFVNIQQVRYQQGKVLLDVELSAEQKIDNLTAYVNGIPYTPTAQRKLSNVGQNVKTTIEIASDQKDLQVRLETMSAQGIGMTEQFVANPVAQPQKKGRLFLITIGVNKFVNVPAQYNLNYAVNDANGLYQALSQKNPLYSEVIAVNINDQAQLKPDKATILQQFKILEQATAQDTILIYLASHGLNHQNEYLFLTRDTTKEDLKKILEEQPTQQLSSLLNWQEILNPLWNVAGKRLLIIDSCHAQQVTQSTDPFSLLKRSAAANIAVLAAAKGNEKSQELGQFEHGLFTFGLLYGLKDPKTDQNHNQLIDLKEWFQSSSQIVKQYQDPNLGEQTPQMVSDSSLGLMSILMNRGDTK